MKEIIMDCHLELNRTKSFHRFTIKSNEDEYKAKFSHQLEHALDILAFAEVEGTIDILISYKENDSEPIIFTMVTTVEALNAPEFEFGTISKALAMDILEYISRKVGRNNGLSQR